MENNLVISSFQLNKNGLVALGTPTFEQWEKCGKFLKEANGAVHFWIGDWLNYGERKYGEMYAQAIDQTSYEYGTLLNDKYVSSRVESSRRRDNLSFSHHQEVASFSPEEQEELLSLAEDESLNRANFRKAVHDYKLKLDLPELSDDEIKPIAEEEFEVVKTMALSLLSEVEKVRDLDWKPIHPSAKAFLISQVKKSIGVLASVVQKNEY
jgi:hypothetical protein